MVVVKKISSRISDDIKKKSQFFLNELFRKMESDMKDASAEARANHRFQNRTYNLDTSILDETVKTENGIDSKLYIHDRAHYGTFVHNGHRSWAPDPFLVDPFFRFCNKINNEIREKLR